MSDENRVPPLRLPGESQRQAFNTEIEEGAMSWVAVAVFSFGMCVFEWMRWVFNWGPQPVTVSLFALTACSVSFFRIQASRERARRHRLGAEGEVKVGENLDWLRKNGYEVLHDLQCTGFNIDHVLIGPGGVVVVETKTRRARSDGAQTIVEFDGTAVRVNGCSPDRDPVDQVRKSADYIARLVQQRTRLRPRIQAAVVFPDVYVKSSGRSDVWVCNSKQLAGAVRRLSPVLAPAEISMIHFVLAIDCRSR